MLAEFFVLTTEGWVSDRCNKEIASFKAMAEGGRKGAAKRWAKGGDSPPIATPSIPQCQPEPEPEPEENKERGRAYSASAPEVDTEGHQPTPAGAACIAMRQAGMSAVNPSDPRLRALLAQGATAEELAGVAADAVAKGKGFAWALVALEGRRKDAQAITLAPKTSESANSRALKRETEAFHAQHEAHARKVADPEEQARIAAVIARRMKVVA